MKRWIRIWGSMVVMAAVIVGMHSQRAYAYYNADSFASSITGLRWGIELESTQIGTNKYSIASHARQAINVPFKYVYMDITLYCVDITNPFNDAIGDQVYAIDVSTNNAYGGYCAGFGESSIGVSDYTHGYGGTTVYLTYNPYE